MHSSTHLLNLSFLMKNEERKTEKISSSMNAPPHQLYTSILTCIYVFWSLLLFFFFFFFLSFPFQTSFYPILWTFGLCWWWGGGRKALSIPHLLFSSLSALFSSIFDASLILVIASCCCSP